MRGTTLALAGVLTLTAPSLRAGVRVEVELISVPPIASVTLVPALRDHAKFPQAWQRLQTMLEQEQATLLAFPVVWSGRGQSISKSVQDWRSPDDPHFPFKLSSIPDWGPDTPFSYDLRDIGFSVEAEATTGADPAAIGLKLAAKLTGLPERKTWSRPPTPNGVTGITERPIFSSLNYTGALTVHSGECLLVSVSRVERPVPACVLLFVRATRSPAAP